MVFKCAKQSKMVVVVVIGVNVQVHEIKPALFQMSFLNSSDCSMKKIMKKQLILQRWHGLTHQFLQNLCCAASEKQCPAWHTFLFLLVLVSTVTSVHK